MKTRGTGPNVDRSQNQQTRFQPRQQLSDIKVSDKLSVHGEIKKEGDTRRVLLRHQGGEDALELAKGQGRTETTLGGHKIVTDGDQMFVDGKRVDFESGNLLAPKQKRSKANKDEFAGTKKAKEPATPDQMAGVQRRLKEDRPDMAGMREALDMARNFDAKTPLEKSEKRRIVRTLEREVAKGQHAMQRMDASNPQAKADAAADLKTSRQVSAMVMGDLAGLRGTQRGGETERTVGIDSAVFKEYVARAVAQLDQVPGGPQVKEAASAGAAKVGQARTYTQARLQQLLGGMNMGDVNRAYNPQATGYNQADMRDYGGAQMPTGLFGRIKAAFTGNSGQAQTQSTVEQPQEKKPFGFGKAALLGVGGAMLMGMGMGPFGMGMMGMGMPMLGNLFGGTILNPLGGFNWFAF